MRSTCLFLVLAMLFLQSCLKIESTSSSDHEIDSVSVDNMVTGLAAQQDQGYTSLTGKRLLSPELDRWSLMKRENELEEAYQNYLSYPDSLPMIYWYGRRLSYLYRYHESIQVYTAGLSKFPESYDLYRHRGHRYLTVRDIDHAIDDLEKAVFYVRDLPTIMEDDVVQNERNIPRSSVQFNIWYHLGLAYYIKGNFDKAVSAYKKCMLVADNHDMLVSATHWLYMTYQKIGNTPAAERLLEPITPKMNIVDNESYHQLLLMYKGLYEPEKIYNVQDTDGEISQLTLGYGVGNWYYNHGKPEQAIEVFEKMMESPYWQAFGYLAAEVELANHTAVAG
ncbi:Tetratricopeptide repeat-containing protein [Reichenbachiella agariperforans]|uniref:Tetratricopeptide repeat-containing protein n=1 Tax=Reichenbachiella agariperforans TaxID=156994 RepID=A0A1M6QAZ4_REIAG|nr:tetratricopeptide repeat protein [Reichenbachiella agariperforans]SHK17439.1 Tetratricopeptide repeat-containing protein [Reichenbachiella agariperforans]